MDLILDTHSNNIPDRLFNVSWLQASLHNDENEYDLQAQMHPVICTYHKPHNSKGNKITGHIWCNGQTIYDRAVISDIQARKNTTEKADIYDEWLW